MSVLLFTTPLVLLVATPFLFQLNKLNVPAVSSEVFTEHVNSTVELIRDVTLCGKGPLMTDSAEQQLQQVTTNKTIAQSLMAHHASLRLHSLVSFKIRVGLIRRHRF